MSQSEHKLELESQFILRLPKVQANALRQAIKSGEPLSKRLSLKFESDVRHGTIKFDNWTMQAKLFDLPTIIESYKTLDRKNFYKTADVSQILICKESNGPDGGPDENDEEARKASQNDLFASVGGAGKREFLFPHGITPPLKNVRKRRFRKTLKKKYVDISEIEKEVKRLFKFDSEAIDIRYEIIEENKLDKMQPSTFNVDNAPSPMSVSNQGIQSTENSQSFDLRAHLFGDEESSDESDDDDDDDDKDDDMDMMDADNDENDDDNMDDDEENMEDSATPAPPVESQVPAADIAAEIAAASDLISQNDDTEEKRQDLNRELAKIRERIETQESEMRGLDNQALRQRLQPVLDSLHEQENELKKQLEELN